MEKHGGFRRLKACVWTSDRDLWESWGLPGTSHNASKQRQNGGDQNSYALSLSSWRISLKPSWQAIGTGTFSVSGCIIALPGSGCLAMTIMSYQISQKPGNNSFLQKICPA